ncbi:zinc finger protein 654-like isoform X1 [Carassius carassius]|uniref:zinc finger protein 654-like isoform X1 n=1 Tax=Carassius carassius TaxID=217509 RepID=UPI002869458B|nr:zinc finger protein 654-like isoform X1 [Carassius carassius]
MAEEESELELHSFKKELETLLKTNASDERGLQSKTYCERFCELVVEQTGQWQVPLPQLQVLQSALCSFVHGAASFPPECEHVRYTLRSLALSIFELLLFFGKDEFIEHPLKNIVDSFQDCYASLVRHQNVYLLRVRQIIKDGGPWANPVLEAILKDSELPQEDVDKYLSSEVSIFFELRVRYLVACERLPEALALTRRCIRHSVVGRHLYFKQAYLICLWRASLHDRLYKGMADINGKDAVEILCMMENEEKDETVLMLSKGFLSQKLQIEDMCYLWDLVFIWSRLYLRLNRSKQGFLEECNLMILSATNTKAIFPFMKVILAELGKDGLGFCVELCARALQTDLKNDPVTKSLIYKTIAYLLPNDLEVCRACALLVFFLERTVESYKNVFLLYTHPDQEYHSDTSLVCNSVRFEALQILKKDLYFDPEFWSLLNIETNCLKLMSDKVGKATLCEIMQRDKWMPSYCVKGYCQCYADNAYESITKAEKHTNKKKQEVESVKTWVNSGLGEASSKLPGKRRGRKPGTQLVKDSQASPVRRSFRQLDLAKNHARQLNSRRQRLLSQQTELNTLKHKGRKPQWLLDQLAARAENSVPQQDKKPRRKPKQSDLLKDISVEEPLDEITMKFSYPDNEVDLSSDVQASLFSTEIPHMTENSTDKTASQENLKWPDHATSLIKLLSESIPCRKKDFRVREEIVFQEQGLSLVHKFHTYSRTVELEGMSFDSLPKDEVKVDYNESKQERESAEQQCEPAETPGNASQIKNAVEIKATPIPVINEEVSTPVEAILESVKEFIQHPMNELSSPQDANTKYPDYGPYSPISPPESTNVDLPTEVKNLTTAEAIPIPNSTEENVNGLHEDAPPVLTEVTMLPDDTGPTLSESEIATSKIVHESTEVPLLSPRPDVTSLEMHTAVDGLVPDLMPPSDAGCQVSFNCSLCNKQTKFQYILRHAMWHHRIDRKCMFCHKRYTHGRSPSVHFKVHIQELKKSNGLFNENICENAIETTLRCAQTRLLKRVNPAVKHRFRNLKMRLNCTLNIKNVHREGQSSEPRERLRARLVKDSDPPSTSEEQKKKVCKMKRKHIRSVLAKRSQSIDENKTFFRIGLARKRAKTMQTLTPDNNNSDTKSTLAHKVNGMTRKRRKVKIEPETNTLDEKVHTSSPQDSKVKIESVESQKDNVKTEPENTEATKDKSKSKKKRKDEMLDSGLKKKKITSGDQKEDGEDVKRRKITNSLDGSFENQEPKDNNAEFKEINPMGHKNGPKPKKPSTPFQGKRTGASTHVRCPVEICTFSAKSILVLSHVLSHHHGDKKALLFFFNFGKEKCLFCCRKLYNPQHFFDHVICHRGELKFPCYHYGCKERYQTRMELSEHMLGHHPLRALCCFPGCSMQVDSSMLLYRHEKTHYRLNTNLEKKSFPKESEPTGHGVPQSLEDGMEAPENSSLSQQIVGTANLKDPGNQDDDGKPLVLNKGSVNYSSKNHSLVNGHSEVVPPKPSDPVTKEQEPSVLGKPVTKQFFRPLPSAYLDESYISMPKRWKEPQVGSKLLGSVSKPEKLSTRQRCSQCFQSFNSEEELHAHKEKCTSLFGFDSDDESAS